MRMARIFMFLIFSTACIAGWARPLTDGVSSTVNLNAEPGLLEIGAQQNLTPYFGFQAGYQKMSYLQSKYDGWEFGSNWRLGQLLSREWKAMALLNVGLSGLQGEGHGHTSIWTRLELDWETRNVMLLFAGGLHRGARMPEIQAWQVKMGYSPFVPELNRIQPWILAAYSFRSGTGGQKLLAILRLLTGDWALDVGSTLNFKNIVLGASLAL